MLANLMIRGVLPVRWPNLKISAIGRMSLLLFCLRSTWVDWMNHSWKKETLNNFCFWLRKCGGWSAGLRWWRQIPDDHWEIIPDRYLTNINEDCLILSHRISSRIASIKPCNKKRRLGAMNTNHWRSANGARGHGGVFMVAKVVMHLIRFTSTLSCWKSTLVVLPMT